MIGGLKVIEELVKHKKRKLNKNRKKAWRKHIDLKDIEVSLEAQQQEERIGCLGEKTDQDLLFLDTGKIEKVTIGSTSATKPITKTILRNTTKKTSQQGTQEGTKKSSQTEASKAPVIEYVVDATTGLKPTSKPKLDKVLWAHKNLAGLPGAKCPHKGVQKRKVVSEEWQKTLQLRRERIPRSAHKTEVKRLMTFVTTKNSYKLSQKIRHKAFDKDLWAGPGSPTIGSGFIAEAMDHTNLVMKKKFVSNCVSRRLKKKIPAILLPHPGSSYNPTLEDHQKLLKKAVRHENIRLADVARQNLYHTTEFPAGAPVGSEEALLVGDMNPELPQVCKGSGSGYGSGYGSDSLYGRGSLYGSGSKKQSNKESGKETGKKISVATRAGVGGKQGKKPPSTAAAAIEESSDDGEAATGGLGLGTTTPERSTEWQRKKKRRHNKLMQEQLEKKLNKKRQNEVYRAEEFHKELDVMDVELERRQRRRTRLAKAAAYKPPKGFQEQDVEVALGDQLSSNLLSVQPTSNAVQVCHTHLYRRGLLPTRNAITYTVILPTRTKRIYKRPDKVETLQDIVMPTA